MMKLNRWEKIAKRFLDVLGGLVGLILSLPILLIAGIAIKLDSPGPVFFVQKRAGENGKPFDMIKLRTMEKGASRKTRLVMALNHLEGPVYKIPNDPRVTGVGRLLRRWSLDELPQFWNVLRGEMSLVGPRPEELWLVAQYTEEQSKRLCVKPGLTGPMQVHGRGDLGMQDRLRLEMDYIRDYSLGKDVSILLDSVPAVISGKGAY
jgi:lipopolysaccharide/colanic/teichoic acid biosynthesis glycosyltransferase